MQTKRSTRADTGPIILRSAKEAAQFRRRSLEFLIRLSEANAEILVGSEAPGDLINVVWRFFSFGYLGEKPLPKAELEAKAQSLVGAIRATPERLTAVVEVLRVVLAKAADGGDFSLPLTPDSAIRAHFGNGEQRHIFLWSRTGDRYEGLRQAVAYSAMTLLNTNEGRMVRRCARQPQCQRIFLATRPKQVFCGRPCASAAAFENYRSRMGEGTYRVKHRESALKSWRRKQLRTKRRAKLGIKD
jgi:hypothetical protein